VLAYRILAAHGVVDAYGHVSLRTAENPSRYLLARAMAPELVTADDIVEFDLDSNPVKDLKAALYLERYIHGEIFKRRPDINAVVHNHSPSVIPFGATSVPLRPLFNTGAFIGEGVPTFEIRDFQESGDLIIKSPYLGASLATSARQVSAGTWKRTWDLWRAKAQAQIVMEQKAKRRSSK
jgi:ribulose-5-phosphate 4-epimerase/fuculose-1-phosphate aldolase